jgi:hypothetical protein
MLVGQRLYFTASSTAYSFNTATSSQKLTTCHQVISALEEVINAVLCFWGERIHEEFDAVLRDALEQAQAVMDRLSRVALRKELAQRFDLRVASHFRLASSIGYDCFFIPLIISLHIVYTYAVVHQQYV